MESDLGEVETADVCAKRRRQEHLRARNSVETQSPVAKKRQKGSTKGYCASTGSFLPPGATLSKIRSDYPGNDSSALSSVPAKGQSSVAPELR